MELDSNAMEAFHFPSDILQDNQNTRVVTLEQEFSNTRIKNFPKVSTYFQRLKMLSDQSRNTDTLVNNHHLVAYRIIATLIRQNNPLPPCYQAHSMLTLVEACMAKMTSNGSHAAIHTTTASDNTSQRGDRRPVNHSRSCNNQGRDEECGHHGDTQPGTPNAHPTWSSPPWQQQQQYSA